MADTRVTIDVDLNSSPAAQGLRDLQRQYNSFTSSLNRNNAAQATAARQYSDQLLNLVNSSQYFTAETVRMRTAAGQLDQTLKKGQVTLGQYFNARFRRNSTEAAQVLSLANARAAALETQFFATSAAANGMRDAIAVRPYQAFNSALAVSAQKLAIHRAMLMQATTQMINFGKNTQWAGRQLMVGFTVPLTIFGGVAGKVFRELEEQAINFKKVYGDIFTTEVETEEALSAVKELSLEFTKYGIAVKDTMELAGVAAQSGLRNAELMAATTQATRLATLGQMEQAEAMKTIISLQTAFQTSNEGLAESVDFLNLIENQTVLALQDVAGAIPRVAPVIQGLGGDVKDLAVLLVAMKEGGVSAGEGANALKSSLGRLIVPTAKASKMAKGFGINLEQIVENNRGELLPMIKELGMAMEGLGDLERQQLLTTIFGKFQYARIGALFDNITRDSSQAARAMDLMSMSAQELGQIAEKELGVVQESVGARFTAAMEKAKVAIAPLGEAFLNLSIPIINLFTNIIEKFNALPDFAKKFAVFGSVLVGVVIPVGTMFLGLLMNLIGTLIKFGAIVGIAFKGFTSGGIKGAITAVSQALNYMSLEEIDAAVAAKQLGDSTMFVNEALRQQVPRSAEATAAINQLGGAYGALVARMREAAALSASQGGAFVVPGAAAAAAAGRRGPRPRGYNKGGKVRYFNEGEKVPGVGNTDTVPAMLTPGEFVVNKQATADNIDILTSINDGNNVQYKNKGGGIATPERMYYGPPFGRRPAPKVMSDEDFIAQAMRGETELEKRFAAQSKEMGIANVSDDAARAAAASGQAATQLQIKRVLQEYVEKMQAGSTKSSKELAEELTSLLQPFGQRVTNEQLSKWMRSNVGGTGRGKAHTWDKDKVSSFIKTLAFDRKTHGAHFGSPKLTSAQARELARLSPDNKIQLAKELVDAGVPVTALTDDWAELSLKLNLSASRSKNTRMNIAEAIDDLETNRDLLVVGPAMKRAGVTEDTLIDGMKKYLSEYAEKNGSSALITDEILTAARNAALSGKTVSPRITGARVPTKEDLKDWVASKRKISDRDTVTDAQIAEELDKIGFDYIYGGKRQTITHRATGISDEIARSSSYERSWADIPEVLQLAKGGRIPGVQYRNPGGEIFESGGKSVVPGIGNRDTVPAMLTPGEFVVNKDATREHKDELKAINSGQKLNIGGRVKGFQFLNAGNPVSDWGDFVDPNEKQRTSKKERFERSVVGRWAAKKLSAGERSGVLLGTSRAMRMNASMTGIVVQELLDYENLSPKQQLKERNIRRAEAGAAKYEKAMQFWHSNGRPAPPPEVRGNAEKAVSGQRTGAAAGSGILANTTPGGPPATDHIYGYDKDKRPIKNWHTAARMAFNGKLFDTDGNKVPPKDVRLVRRGIPFTPGPPDDAPKQKFGMTRAQKIWAVISALTMAGVGTGIAINEKNKNDQFPINMFNKGGRVPAMLTPGEFIVDKENAENNLNTLYAINNGMKLNKGGKVPGYALGGAVAGAAKFIIPMGLSIPAGMAGAKAGESMGGDTGAMIGGMAGGMLPFALASLPFGRMLPKKAVPLEKGGPHILKQSTVPAAAAGQKAAAASQKTAAAANTTAKSMLTTAAQFLRLGRLIPLLFNPYTALAAAVIGTAYTFVQMQKSNNREYEAGRKLAEAMSTSSEDIERIGKTAKQRAKNIDNYLDQSESAAIEQEYATKISEAKTKEEKKKLELERDAIVKERGNQTRRESVEKFYKKEIEEAKKRNVSQEELRRLYDQRNMSLGVQFQKEAEFEIDKTFGAEFIKGAGEKQFKQFEAVRGASAMVSTGQISQAQANTMTRLADATYGMSMSFEKMAERDMASKLAQYVVSGTLTQDQAASVAEAIGAEMGDLQIGKSIREELTGIVGVEGGRARYSPGLVATQLAEENARRVEELRQLTYSRAGAMFTTNPNAARDIGSGVMLPSIAGFAAVGITQPSRTFDEETFREGAPTGFNFFTQFFSGMADEFRRNIGSLIELQANEVQMLEENIAAVGLNYNDLIAKAKTLEEAERLRLERARAVGKLQERLDEARTKQLQMAFGTENQEAIERMLEPYRRRTETMQRMNERRASIRQEFREIDPLTSSNFLQNIFDRTMAGVDLSFNNLLGGILSLNNRIQKDIQKRFPSGMAELMTKQTREALISSYEGTPMQASLGMFESIFDASAETPEFVRIYTEALNDPEFAEAVFGGFESGIRKVKAAVEAGQLDYGVEESVMGELTGVLKSFSLPTDTIQEYGMLLNQLNAEQIYNVTEAFKQLGQTKGLEVQEQAMERFLPLFTQLGQISAIDMPGLGGKNIIESIFGDEKTFAILGKNDEVMEDMMKFITFVSELPSELQIGFLEDKTIDQMIKAGRELNKFDASRFRNSIRSIKSLLKDGFKLEGKEIDEGVRLIELSLNRLNEIEDPEIKASLKAEISPLIYEMLRLMRELDSASVTEAQDIFDRILLLQDEVTEATNAAVQKEEETVKKSGGGGGSAKESPLNQLLRDLRDQISAREKIGRDIYGANEKAKGIFTKLRKQNASQSVIDYLKSLSPEDAISVGQELLKNEKKLNSLMALQSQNAIAQQREAAKTAKSRKETMQFLDDSRLFGQKTFTFGAEALQDEEFISGFEKAMADPKNARKAAREFLENYTRTRKQERDSLIAQRRIMVGAEIQRNRQDQRLAIELVEEGLDQTEIETALKNDLIREDIAKRIEEGKKIPQEIVSQIKSLVASQKTPIDQINESVDDILNVYTEMSNILQAAIDKIETFNIKPLEEELQDIQRESAEYSEQQRRLSRTLSDLQEKENDLKEEQKEEEEKINESYDLRIKALEKINDVNKDIEDRQKGQLTVADALSRGDIAAAAKAAQEMQAKAAQARREEAIEAVKERKEEDIANFKEASEQKLKELTIDVNGELLNREQIEERINNLDQQIYDNSLLQYDLQQKITAERDKQQKIAEAQQKVAAASNIVSRIAELGDQSLAPEDRRMKLMGIQAELRAQDTPGAEQLLSFLESNSQQIISGNIREISEGLAGALNVFNEGFGQEFQRIISSDIYKDIIPPDISGIMQEALDAADASIQLALDDINENTELFKQEVEKKDPFATLIGGVKRLSRLAKELLKDLPKKAGNGKGPGPDEPGDDDAAEGEESKKIGTSIPEPENMQKVERRYTLKNGLVVTVTRYYDPITGNPVPDKNGRPLTIYETQRREEGPGGGIITAQTDVSQAVSDMRNPITGYEGPIRTLPSSVLAPGGRYEENKLRMQRPDPSRVNYAMYDADIAVSDVAKKLSKETGMEIGEDIVRGVAEGVVEMSIAYNEDAIRQALIDMMKDQVEASSPAKAMFPVGGYVASGLIQGAINWFTAPAKFIWDSIKSYFESETGTENGDSTKTESTGASLLKGMLNGLVSALIPSSLWTPVWTWIKEAFGMTSDAEEELEKTKPAGASIISGIFSGITSFLIPGKLWSSLWTWISGDTTSDAANTNNTSTGNKIISGIFNGITTFLTPGKLWSKIWSWISGDFSEDSEAPDHLMSVGGEGSNGTKGIMGGIKDGIIDWIENTSFAQFINDVIDGFNKALGEKNIIDGLSSIGGAIWKLIGDAVIAAIPGGQFASTMVNFVSSAVRRMYGGVIPKMAYGGMVNFKGSREPAPGMMMGGKVKKYAAGGFVPGRGMTDKVPALLTPGEFVVRKSVAQQMLPTLKEMNSQVFPGMGVPQQRSFSVSSPQFDTMKKMSVDQVRFGVPQTLNSFTYPTTNMNMTQSNTDMSPTNNNVGPTNVQYTYNLSVNANTNASPDDIANTVIYKIKRFDDRKIRGTQVG